MSTYYDGTLYIKENGKWNAIRKNIDMNCVKNFSDSINSINDIDVEDALFEFHKNVDFFNSYEFAGYITREEAWNIVGEEEFSTALLRGENMITENPYYHHPVDTTFVVEDASKLEEKFVEKSEDVLAVYTKQKNVYNGVYCNNHSFDEIIEFAKKHLDNIKQKKEEWDKIRTSIDYLKLSMEEKENAFESYKYEIEDEDNYYRYMLEGAEMLKSTLTLFSDYDKEVVFFIYNTDDYRKE